MILLKCKNLLLLIKEALMVIKSKNIADGCVFLIEDLDLLLFWNHAKTFCRDGWIIWGGGCALTNQCSFILKYVSDSLEQTKFSTFTILCFF